MRISVTNTNPVDIVVDTEGDGKPENMVIVHPKNTVGMTIKNDQFSTIKQIPGAVVHLTGGK